MGPYSTRYPYQYPRTPARTPHPWVHHRAGPPRYPGTPCTPHPLVAQERFTRLLFGYTTLATVTRACARRLAASLGPLVMPG